MNVPRTMETATPTQHASTLTEASSVTAKQALSEMGFLALQVVYGHLLIGHIRV